MIWSVLSIIIMLLLLTSQNMFTKNTQQLSSKEPHEIEAIKKDAQMFITSSNEIAAMKSLRKKYGLSIVDAKKVIDLVK